MSYRTNVEDFQIFGNNEYYPEWIEYIKSKGIYVDEDGCYDGELDNFVEALEIIEKIVIRLYEDRELENKEVKNKIISEDALGLFDLSYIPKRIKRQEEYGLEFKTPLLDMLFAVIHDSYAFMPYAFYVACKDKLEIEDMIDGRFECYKLKQGQTISVHAG